MRSLSGLPVKNLCFIAISFSLISTGGSTTLSDSSTTVPQENALSAPADSAAQEKEFQEDVNSLFNPDLNAIDTSGWCTYRINASRFDYTTMCDSLRIVLVDSSQKRLYVHPFNGYITSPFGPRGGFWHFGTDIKVKWGDTIRCVLDGIVRVATNDRRGYGRVVVVRHRNGLETIYGHLSRTLVFCNQQLKAGDAIGRGGSTGRSTGTHLHFEMRYCGEPFNPECVVDFENGMLKNDTLVISRGDFEYLTELRKTLFHTIRRGETLGGIARRYGTNVRKLCSLNRISTTTLLGVGRKIIVRKNTGSDTEGVSIGGGDPPGT